MLKGGEAECFISMSLTPYLQHSSSTGRFSLYDLYGSTFSPSFQLPCRWGISLSYSCTPLRDKSLRRSELGALPCYFEPIIPNILFPRPRLRLSDQDVRKKDMARLLRDQRIFNSPRRVCTRQPHRLSGLQFFGSKTVRFRIDCCLQSCRI